MTPQERRNIRLKNDYQQMCNIKSDIIEWTPVRGIAPHVEEYRLTIHIRTIVSSTPSYRTVHELTLSLPSTYPTSAPIIKMTTMPKPFHPNWYPDGKWCPGNYLMTEGLGDFVIRMIRTLQFDPDITNPNSAADGTAKNWYLTRTNQRYFPCDTTSLPDPTNTRTPASGRFNVQEESPKKRFNIR